jgi:capsular polysaccharide biosynthesis protein
VSELRELLARDDPATAYARSKLQAVSQQYNEILNHMHLAKVELDVARASLKDTYSVARPAEMPTKARTPNVPVLLVAGLMGAILLGFVTPAARDLLTGRFIEPWQVEMSLKLPVLGELPAPMERAPPEPGT